MGFYVIRHLQAGLGTCPVDALDLYLAVGWFRVSDARPEPADFHLPDFADATDRDAPAQSDAPAAEESAEPDTSPAAKPAKTATAKESK